MNTPERWFLSVCYPYPTLAGRLRDRWLREGVAIRPGATPGAIRAFEGRYGVVLPADFREYFAAVDGMEPGDCDGDLFEFVSLEAVRAVPEELVEFRGIPDYGNIARTLPGADRYFVFCDFMIGSHVYAIRLSEDASEATPIAGICGDHHWHAAASFTEFAEKYLKAGVRELL